MIAPSWQAVASIAFCLPACSGVLLSDIQPLLDALGLKAVDKSKVCVDKDIYTSLKAIAGAAFEAPQKLEWE